MDRLGKTLLHSTSPIPRNYFRASSSFLSSSHYLLEKMNIKVTQKIGDKYKEIIDDVTGLQSILKNHQSNIFNRSEIEEPEGLKEYPSDTKSTKSESNSLTTYISSASNGVNSKQSNTEVITPNSINDEDLIQKYYKELRNALKNCILTKKASVTFKDIAGNTYAKKIIQEAFVLPNLFPSYFTGKPKAWNKILLYGPPGVGKTMMCQAVANEMNAVVLWVSLADITSKYTGESEKLLITLFDMAREKSPSVIVIDEMDSIGRKRSCHESETERRIKTEFLKQLDGISGGNDGVYVLATTNMPWELDIACLRRFERLILLPIPDTTAREEIFKLRIGDHPHELKPEDFKSLAKLTEGYSGSDINNVVNDAMMKPVRMLQETCYFKVIKQGEIPKKEETRKTETTYNDEEQPNGNNDNINAFDEYYMPCFESDKGAIQKNLNDIPKDQIILRKLNLVDFKESIKNVKPTVRAKFLPLYNDFLLKYGHEEQRQDLWKESKEHLDYFM